MAGQAAEGQSSEVVVNQDGRVLIPAQIRRDLQMDPGATLILSVEDGRVVLETREQLIERMRREIAESWTGDPDTSPADELIAERRAEAATENAAR